MLFLPKEKKFFDLYESLDQKIIQGVELFKKLEKNYDTLSQVTESLNHLEDEADEIVHQIVLSLHYDHTRVTEEKGDIRSFAHNLDNIIDSIEKVANCLYIYQIPNFPQTCKEFLPYLEGASLQIKKAINCLKNVTKFDRALADCIIRINDMENAADKVNRKWLAQTMNEKYHNLEDFKKIIALKEIIEYLEYTMDQCEDVANILETFRLKGTA